MRIEPIESLDDPRVADYRNLRNADLRAGEGLFVAEGRRNVKRLILASSHQARAAADVAVTIPMSAGIDSLNVATASGIALHHLNQLGAGA